MTIYAYFVLEKDIYNQFIISRFRLCVTYTLEEKKTKVPEIFFN